MQFPPNIALRPVYSGFNQPLYLTHDGDSSRLYVVEKAGRVILIKGGQPQPTPFLDITDRVKSDEFEQGLFSIAFPPDFTTSRIFYVMYTDLDGDSVLSRFGLNDGTTDEANPASELMLLQVEQPGKVHNGGLIRFGPDGKLYIGMGDGQGSGDPPGNAQSLGSLLGKVLRIEVGAVGAYTVPADNPFVGQEGAQPEIWALGLRNPWRFSFDLLTGDLYVADVGQNRYEEVNFQPASSAGGENYGWNIVEGNHCFKPTIGCDPTGTVPPVFEYDHDQGCSVTGGYVYRGSTYPKMDGTYFFGDFCAGTIWALRWTEEENWSAVKLLESGARISSFGEDADGELYVLDIVSGIIYRIIGRATVGDFEGDLATNVAIYRPGSGRWFIQGLSSVRFGVNDGDVPAPGDYDGDGVVDIAIYRPGSGRWFIRGLFNVTWGVLQGDVPVPGDYDGDGVVDIAIYRPGSGRWFIRGLFNVTWGVLQGDVPVPGDYDGDGVTDVAIYRPGSGRWFIRGLFNVAWGVQQGDIPVPGDYDGDGVTDVAIWRPSNRTWYIIGQSPVSFGQPGDIPVPGDYDGDRTTDIAVYRPASGRWFVKDKFSSTLGQNVGDRPLPVEPFRSYWTCPGC